MAFDTQATFDFEQELKLEHTGTEDQILQKIEAGNVQMPLGKLPYSRASESIWSQNRIQIWAYQAVCGRIN